MQESPMTAHLRKIFRGEEAKPIKIQGTGDWTSQQGIGHCSYCGQDEPEPCIGLAGKRKGQYLKADHPERKPR